MIVVQDTESQECKFTIVFEPDEVWMLEDVFSKSESCKNLEDAVHSLLTGWQAGMTVPEKSCFDKLPEEEDTQHDLYRTCSVLVTILKQTSLYPMLNLDEKATVLKTEESLKKVASNYTLPHYPAEEKQEQELPG